VQREYWHAVFSWFPCISELGVTVREFETDRSLTTGLAARLACRRGALCGTTAGVAPGYVQGNLAILPKDLAADFLRFCQANPKPCPLIGVSDPGSPKIPSLGLDLDTILPAIAFGATVSSWRRFSTSACTGATISLLS
jgi:hypothetical protein